jgi:hypothetical protein
MLPINISPVSMRELINETKEDAFKLFGDFKELHCLPYALLLSKRKGYNKVNQHYNISRATETIKTFYAPQMKLQTTIMSSNLEKTYVI